MENFDLRCAQIAEMTDDNAHNEAYVAGCELLGVPGRKLKKLFENVNAICELEGELPHGLGEYRYGLYKRMMQLAKTQMNDVDYEKFYGSF